MENENLELEIVTEDNTEGTFVGSDAFPDPTQVPEEVQNIQEEVQQEVPEEAGPVFEELLKEFLEQKLNEGENEEQEQTENSIDSINDGNISLLSDSNSIDYTQVLDDLLSYSQDILLSVNTVNDNYDIYMQNNDINADINNISLSNYLLLLVFIALLFNAVVNFARRIF